MHPIVYDILYYVYVLLFASYISMGIACGEFSSKERRVFTISCPLLLILQGICLQLCGMERVWMLYPLITHLPIVLLLILPLKTRWDTALATVVISYSVCQILRWIGLVIDAFEMLPIVSFILHLSFCHLFFLFFKRYCIPSMHSVVNHPPHLLKWFSALPILYYLYEYFMLFTRDRYVYITAFSELLPTAMVLFFILFTVTYQKQMEKRKLAEFQALELENELSQAEHEITVLRVVEEQTAIHRHDLRHHFAMIDGMLSAGKPEQAAAYIHEVEKEIQSIVPERYCENETVNLLFGAFKARAGRRGIAMNISASLPADLDLPYAELCAMLSNGLENALNAVSTLAGASGSIDVFCDIKQKNLLFEIKNPYEGEIQFRDGVPQSKGKPQGYGCRSIQAIVQKRNGICTFEASQGIFKLRIVLPMNCGTA